MTDLTRDARSSPLATATTRGLVSALLAEPDLPARVREMPPAQLARVVARVGLEDASELVALATAEQLLVVLDEDAWRSPAPGEDDRFDPARFVTWLEVLVEAGDAVVADKLAGLPEDLLVLALHARLLVVPMARLADEIAEAEDGELADKALSDHLHEELDEVMVVAREPDGWDAVLAALLALDRDHHDLLGRVLDRCAAMAEAEIDEAGGLYTVLSAEASLAEDVAGDREDRRAKEGHVAPSAARSFLALARRPLTAGWVRDVVTRSWLRDVSRAEVPAPAVGAGRAASLLAALAAPERDEPPARRRRPAKALGSRKASELLLTAGMGALATEAPAAFGERSEELAFLANVVAAGCTLGGQRVRQAEAVRIALATTSLGLELVADGARPEDVLASRTADELFRRAVHALHTRLAVPAAAVTALDAEQARALAALKDEIPHRLGPEGEPVPFARLREVERAEASLRELGRERCVTRAHGHDRRRTSP